MIGILVVYNLFEKLDGTLGTLVVCEGHVQIVNELNNLAEWVLRSVLNRVFFVHFAHDETEQLAREDVIIQGSRNRADFVVFLTFFGDPVNELINEGGFASSGPADYANRAVGELVQLHDTALLEDVQVRHNDLEVHKRAALHAADVVPGARYFLLPLHPFPGFGTIELVQQHFFLRHALAFLAHLLIEEFQSRFIVYDASEGPCGCLVEQHSNGVFALLFIGLFEFNEAFALFVVEEVRVNYSSDGLTDSHAAYRYSRLDFVEIHNHHRVFEPTRVVAKFDLRLNSLQQLVFDRVFEILRAVLWIHLLEDAFLHCVLPLVEVRQVPNIRFIDANTTAS